MNGHDASKLKHWSVGKDRRPLVEHLECELHVVDDDDVLAEHCNRAEGAWPGVSDRRRTACRAIDLP